MALYGGLCALAMFDRSELQSKVIGSVGFREFLELHPQVRDLIHDFHNSRYASCLAHLAALRPALALDIHLHDHAQVGKEEGRGGGLVVWCRKLDWILHLVWGCGGRVGFE